MRAADFNCGDYVRKRYPKDAITYSAARIRQTKRDPLLFGLTYFGSHLESEETGHEISFSDFHLDLAEHAKTWMDKTGPMENRRAWVAARGSGKSTWLFPILPPWGLAHGHRKYVAAFADTATQAETHLKSLKMELDTNELLRFDFPAFCSPSLRPDGRTVADDQSLTVRANDAVFMAKGIDSSALGAKVGSQRPDCILFDDIEPDEANYSPAQKASRLATITQAVFPMNTSAVVTFAGTVTMPGSVIHDLHDEQALKRIHGAYALAMFSTDDPELLIGARLNAPLVVGLVLRALQLHQLAFERLALIIFRLSLRVKRRCHYQ